MGKRGLVLWIICFQLIATIGMAGEIRQSTLSDLHLSADTVRPGEILSFTAKLPPYITDVDLSRSSVYAVSEGNRIKFAGFVADPANHEVTFNLNIKRYEVAGLYLLQDAWLMDAQGTIHQIDLTSSGIGFEVINPESDSEAPQIEKTSIHLSSHEVKAGDTVIISVDASDNLSGVDPASGEFGMNMPPGSHIPCLVQSDPRRFNAETGRMEFPIEIPEYPAPGKYTVHRFFGLRDLNGNLGKLIDLDDLDLSFTVVNKDYRNSPPLVVPNSISLSSRSLTIGETLHISVVVTDDYSGVDPTSGGFVVFMDPDGYFSVMKGPEKKPGQKDMFKGVVNPKYIASDQRMEFDLPIDSDFHNGDYPIILARGFKNRAGQDAGEIDLVPYHFNFHVTAPNDPVTVDNVTLIEEEYRKEQLSKETETDKSDPGHKSKNKKSEIDLSLTVAEYDNLRADLDGAILRLQKQYYEMSKQKQNYEYAPWIDHAMNELSIQTLERHYEQAPDRAKLIEILAKIKALIEKYPWIPELKEPVFYVPEKI